MSELKFININERAYKYIRQFTIKSLGDALIELITNSIDAYNKSNIEKRVIDIEYFKPDQVKIRDYAIGLSGEEMQNCFLQVGKYTNVTDSRGFFSRGAKDISAIGDIIFEAIKDNKYTKVLLNNDAYGKTEVFEEEATQEIRKSTKILDSNGLVVTIKLLSNFLIQDPVNFSSTIEKTSVLREINSDPNNIINYNVFDEKNNNICKKRIFYKYPEGKLLLDVEFNIQGYPGKIARFVVYESKNPIPQPLKENEMEFGFLIKSNRTVYEVGTIDNRFRWHPYIQYVYGYLLCDHIHEFLIDYDSNGPTKLNPMPIIDPSRLSGVNKQHPFIIALHALPKVRLDQILRELNSRVSSRSINLNDMDSLFNELSNYGLQILDNKDIKFTFTPNYDSQLAKAIQNDRAKYVRSEKNYLLPENNDIKLSDIDIKVQQHIESLDSEPNSMFILDADNNIIEIPMATDYNMSSDSIMDMLSMIPEDQLSSLKEKPYIYTLNKGKLNKLYIFQKGRLERMTNPEDENTAFKIKNFTISFINDINLNQRYDINYDSGIHIKINIASESVKKYLIDNDLQENMSSLNADLMTNNKSSKSLIFLKELMLEIFTSIILENDIINNQVILDSDSFNNSKKILVHRNKISYGLENAIETIFQGYIDKNYETKLTSVQTVIQSLTCVVKKNLDISNVPILYELKNQLQTILVKVIE